jgi:hypothetical protein
MVGPVTDLFHNVVVLSHIRLQKLNYDALVESCKMFVVKTLSNYTDLSPN